MLVASFWSPEKNVPAGARSNGSGTSWSEPRSWDLGDAEAPSIGNYTSCDDAKQTCQQTWPFALAEPFHFFLNKKSHFIFFFWGCRAISSLTWTVDTTERDPQRIRDIAAHPLRRQAQPKIRTHTVKSIQPGSFFFRVEKHTTHLRGNLIYGCRLPSVCALFPLKTPASKTTS